LDESSSEYSGAQVFYDLMSARYGSPSNERLARRWADSAVSLYRSHIERRISAQPAGEDLREEERLGILALRAMLGLDDRMVLEEATSGELEELRRHLASGLRASWTADHAESVAQETAATAARERLRHFLERDLRSRLDVVARLNRQKESGEHPGLLPTSAAIAKEHEVSSDQPPTSGAAPSTPSTCPVAPSDQAATAEGQSVTFTFSTAEVRELEEWTRTETEALRAFIRSALGNHVFIQQQYRHGNDFLLQEYGPDGKPKRERRRVRFR
jgi:hypothetical protein